MKRMTSFQLVSMMNTSFGNPKGDPSNIDWERVAKQTLNIPNEVSELFIGLGADPEAAKAAAEVFKESLKASLKTLNPDLNQVRDSSRDIVVYADGTHHLMGVDGDWDMEDVILGVMSRFIKDGADKQATIEKHAALGVTDVYFEGEFPRMIMKSASDQPDAPKGKFLKSASYKETVFYDPIQKEKVSDV